MSQIKRLTKEYRRSYTRTADKIEIVKLAIDGPDGVGKETLTNGLAKSLNEKGFPVLISDYPNYNLPWGKVIKNLLYKEERGLSLQDMMLSYSLNRIESIPLILAHLSSLADKYDRVAIIFDRYATSNVVTLAYYAHAHGLDLSDKKVLRKYYDLMWELDDLLITSLDLSKTPVCIPLMDVDGALEAMQQDESRDELDQNENVSVQSLANSLYARLGNTDERLKIYDQMASGKRMSPEENVEKCLEISGMRKISGTGDKIQEVTQILKPDVSPPVELLEGWLDKYGSNGLKELSPYK